MRSSREIVTASTFSVWRAPEPRVPRAVLRRLGALGCVLGFALGCASADAGPSTTGAARPALSQSGPLAAGAETEPSVTPEYFEVLPDRRRCAAPLCGGYFIRALNRVWTRCADGRRAARCYVAEADWSGTGVPEGAGAIIARGKVESRVFAAHGDLGRFVAFALGDLLVGRAWLSARTMDAERLGSRREEPAEACQSDADCPAGTWCRSSEQRSYSCVPFAREGARCNGVTAPWEHEECSPELFCDVPEQPPDAPGICRRRCSARQ